MDIAIVGTGYVGLVSGACLAELGHRVTCVDNNDQRIALLRKGEMPFYEPELADIVARNSAAGRLSFTTDIGEALAGRQAIFIAVGTPGRPQDGRPDLSGVRTVAEEIANRLEHRQIVIVKSTVPVGTSQEIQALIARRRPDVPFCVAFNPEFLREGSAVHDFFHPDRIVFGLDDDSYGDMLSDIYGVPAFSDVPLLLMSRRSAELVKYASNAFLAMKVAFVNEISDLCENADADVEDVARGIGSDTRIGDRFLRPGPGFGGSCFPKDTVALARLAQDLDSPVTLVETLIEANDTRKQAMVERVLSACGGDVAGRTVAMLGLTFKPDTDDVRDSPAIEIARALAQRGALVRAFDPEGMPNARLHLPEIAYCDDAYEAARDASVIVVATEWAEFRSLDLPRLARQMERPVLLDLRNLFSSADAAAAGFDYDGIGRPATARRPPLHTSLNGNRQLGSYR